MADAQNTEFKSYNLHSAGTDYVEGSALVVKSSSGAIAVDGLTVGSIVALHLTGDRAHDAADDGYPIKIGGVGDAGSPSVVADGDRVNGWFTVRGAQIVSITAPILTAAADATSNSSIISVPAPDGTTTGLYVGAFSHVFTGTGWDRQRGTTDGTYVQGGIAHDLPVSGRPVWIGGVASTAIPTAVSADGDVVQAWATRRGSITVNLRDDTGNQPTMLTWANGDGQVVANVTALSGNTLGWVYNGTTADRMRGDATTGVFVGGAVAHDGVDAGNPVKIGGVANATAPAVVASGDRTNAWFGTNGQQMVQLTSGASIMGMLNWPGQENASPVNSLPVSAQLYAFDGGTSVDRIRTSPGDVGGLAVGGPTAADAATTVAPVTIGGRASTAVPTAVSADGDVVDARFLRTGALTVHVVDASGAAASLGGGTQYVEDVAFGGNGTGTLMVARRDDALATLTPVEDDAVGLRVNSRGALWATITDSSGNVGSVSTFFGQDNNTIAGMGAFLSASGGLVFNGTGWDRVRGVPAVDGNNALGAGTGIQAVGVGPGFARRHNPSNLGTAVNNASTVDVNGATMATIQTNTSTTGTYRIEVTADGTTWVTAYGSNGQIFLPGTPDITPAVGSLISVDVAGMRQLRLRTTATLGATVAHVITLSLGMTQHHAITTGITTNAGDGSSLVQLLGTNNHGPAIFGAAGFSYNGTNYDRVRSAPGVTGTWTVGGPTAADAAIAVAPVTIGGRASAAVPSAVSADGDVVNAWYTTRGALNVNLVDTAGNQLALNGLIDYVEDSALGAVGSAVGKLQIGRASAAAPTAVSADADAVAAWYLRSGQQVVSLAGGTTLVSAGNGTATAALRVAMANDATIPGVLKDDDALGATPSGYLVAARRDDALATLTPIEDDQVALRVGDKGALWVQIADGSGNQITSFGGGTQYVGDAAATSTPTGTMLMGLANSSTPVDVSANNDAVAAWFLRNGAQVVALAAGNTQISATSSALNVAAVGIQAHDAALTVAPVATAGRASTAVPSAVSADGDVVYGWLTRTGATVVDGGIAHDAVDSGSPIKMGGYASGTAPTSVTAGDRVNAWLNLSGAQMVSTVLGQGAGADGASNTNIATFVTAGAGSQAMYFGSYGMLYNGTTWDRTRSAAGVTGALAVGGLTASDAVLAAAPLTFGGRASTAVPTAVSADGDVVDARFLRTGALTVHVVDASGNAASMGGGTQYAEDTALGATPTGTLSLGIRDDALATLTPIEGDAIGLRVGDKGALWVQISDGSGNQITSFGGGTQYVEDVALGATPTGTLSMGVGSDALPTAVSADGDAVGLWASPEGALNVIIRDPAGTAATNGVQYVEDTVITANAGQGTLVVGRRDDALSALTPAENDAVGIRVNGFGALWGELSDDTGAALGKRVDGFVTAAASPSGASQAVLQPDRRFTSVSLGTAANSTQSWDTMAADSILIHCGTTTTGTFIFEVSADGTNWVSGEARDVVLDQWVSGTNITPAANKVYRVVTNGWRSVRARTVSTLGATVALIATLAAHSTVLNALDSGPAPHNFGYSQINLSETFTTAQTSTAINAAPGNADNAVSSTQRCVVTSIQIQAYATTAFTCVVYFGTGAFTRGTNRVVFDGEFLPSTTAKPGYSQAWAVNAPIGDADQEVRITTVGAGSVTVNVWGYLIAA